MNRNKAAVNTSCGTDLTSVHNCVECEEYCKCTECSCGVKLECKGGCRVENWGWGNCFWPPLPGCTKMTTEDNEPRWDALFTDSMGCRRCVAMEYGIATEGWSEHISSCVIKSLDELVPE